jgi:hypothetical protein
MTSEMEGPEKVAGVEKEGSVRHARGERMNGEGKVRVSGV